MACGPGSVRAAFEAIGLTLLLVSLPADSAVESFSARAVCSARRYEPAQVFPLPRGTGFDLVVQGFGVDNADRVEAVSLPGVKVRIAARRSFPQPQITVSVKVEPDASLGKGELRLRYPVEVAGYDRILAEIVSAAPCGTPAPKPRS